MQKDSFYNEKNKEEEEAMREIKGKMNESNWLDMSGAMDC